MERLLRWIKIYNKKADKPITETDVRIALMLNRHLLIRKYDRRRKASKRV